MSLGIEKDTGTAPLLQQQEVYTLISQATSCIEPVAPEEVHGHRAGDWPGTRIGHGLDFEESRPYAPSDAMRDMDWRSTARLGHAYVKTYREERQPISVIVIDRGALMRFGTRKRLKIVQAARTAIWLGTQAIASAAAVSVVLWNPDQDDWLGPLHHRQGWLDNIDRIIQPAPPLVFNATEPERDKLRLRQLVERNPPGCRMFLITDFLWLGEAHHIFVAALAEAASLHCIRISDPLEREIVNTNGVTLTSPQQSFSCHLGARANNWAASANQIIDQVRGRQKSWVESLGVRFTDLCVTQDSLYEGISR